MKRFHIEALPNGLTRVRDRDSGLTACYTTATGRKAFGDLCFPTLESIRQINH